ncbi:putative set [Hibiscus syriacus]|uniref:Set n=1 Tax=Hibiscus syriacus TaxID=106335 RepID=A0A6A2XJZ0_HIBSY|nr:putative set [Hibiscus syriacus]
MVALRYFPATNSYNNGLTQHEDGNCFSFVFQDDAGGLQVRKDGEWIPVIPTKGTLVVNLCDVIQGDKWVEPLPHFTKDMGKSPSNTRLILPLDLKIK